MSTINEFKPVQAYRDKEHEIITRQEMEVSRSYLQVVLSEYLKLDIGSPSDIDQLLMRPEALFNKTLQTLIEVPETASKFKVSKAAHMKTLELPDPSALYAACNTAKKQKWCAVSGLWAIEGKKVVLNEAEALIYIDRQSIYANTPEKAKLAQDLQKLCELWNNLNERLNGELIDPRDSFLRRFAAGKFTIRELPYNKAMIELNPEAIKRWLSL